MDALYIVLSGRLSDELVYSLRSLDTCFSVDRVFFMGRPHGNWNVTIVPGTFEKYGDKWSNLDHAWRQIPHVDGLSEEFLYMNDDFFFMRETDAIPVMYRGELGTSVPRDNYAVGRIEVRAFLEEHDLPILNYEMHVPMVLNKNKIAEMYGLWDRDTLFGFQRSLYGNVTQIGGIESQDVKCGDAAIASFSCDPDTLFLSSDTVSWYRSPVFKELRSKYTSMSRWEAREEL